MGKMYFPGEKIKVGKMLFPGEKVSEYLPPRKHKSNDDMVARFGAWLTKKGAVVVYYGTYFLLFSCVSIRLIIWIIQTIQDNILLGFLSVYGALILLGICIIPLIIISMIACAIAWLLGWVCYNKWTLLVCLILALLWYFSFGNQMMMEWRLEKLKILFVNVWEWYKNVL